MSFPKAYIIVDGKSARVTLAHETDWDKIEQYVSDGKMWCAWRQGVTLETREGDIRLEAHCRGWIDPREFRGLNTEMANSLQKMGLPLPEGVNVRADGYGANLKQVVYDAEAKGENLDLSREICHCGTYVDEHTQSDNHSPVAMKPNIAIAITEE